MNSTTNSIPDTKKVQLKTPSPYQNLWGLSFYARILANLNKKNPTFYMTMNCAFKPLALIGPATTLAPLLSKNPRWFDHGAV